MNIIGAGEQSGDTYRLLNAGNDIGNEVIIDGEYDPSESHYVNVGLRTLVVSNGSSSNFLVLDEDGVWARFLAEEGEGVHHVAVATPDFGETIARAKHGDNVILSAEHGGVEVAYLDTRHDLGTVLEVFSGFPGGNRDEEAP